MDKQPPKKALQFLRWFCREDYLEEIEGDLIELFEQLHEEHPRRARRHFFWQVLRHFRPDFIRPFFNHSIINSSMYRHYFKIAWRSMLKQKLYSGINIGGLALGLSCFILIMLYIQHELSFDRQYPNTDRIYRVYQRQAGNAYLGSDYFAVTPAGLAAALPETYPEIEQATALVDRNALLGTEEDHYWEQGMLADEHVFEVLPLQFMHGNPQQALEQAESIVLTQSLAEKIFGKQDPMGESIIYNNDQPFTVTGVIADQPTNSSLNFSFIASILSDGQFVRERKRETWNNNSYHTFLSLKDQADPEQLEKKLSTVFEQHTDADKADNYPFRDSYYLQHISDLHLTTNVNFDIGLKGNRRYISLFSLVAVLVLLLACVNYMNLAIARSIKRAKEVGLRKVIGARRRQLIIQFIGESVMIAFLALLLAIGLTYLLAPVFSHLLERPIVLSFTENLYLLPSLLGLVCLVGILSGSYPALFMSSLRPTQVLKGKVEGRFAGGTLQKLLIIGQYAASVALIISSLVIYRQFDFIQSKELGYDREHIVSMRIKDFTMRDKREQLQDEWMKNPKVISASFSTSLPTNVTSSTVINDDEGTPKDDDLLIYETRADYNFLDLFGIELLVGRNFSPDFQTDGEQAYMINETAAKALGYTPQEAIGKQFTHEGTETIIGVVKDFHMHSMHMRIEPLMIRLQPEFFTFISVKISPEDMPGTLSYLESSIKAYSPYPVDFEFLDAKFNELYKADLRLGEMFGILTAISILIASLGLFGLAAFVTNQRTKEIGIRKILGASARSIVALLSTDFMRMVLIGFLLSIPIAWYSMHHWLEDFAYRVDLEWWLFALAGLAALLLAFFTVGTQSLRAVFANPVDALRNE